MRPVTWVRINEFESGDWAIGGKALKASDVRARVGQGCLVRVVVRASLCRYVFERDWLARDCVRRQLVRLCSDLIAESWSRPVDHRLNSGVVVPSRLPPTARATGSETR